MSIDADLVLREAREVQHVELGRERAVELASELESLLGAASRVAQDVSFDDDPGAFATSLWRLRDASWCRE